MILPGKILLTRSIIHNLPSPSLQTQPCGMDLTLKRILRWTSPGTIDLDNTHRETASTEEIPFPSPTAPTTTGNTTATNATTNENISQSLHLPLGAYLIEFNETVSVPLDLMGQIFVRSSLFRSGVLIHAGVMDSGYNGAVGALMQVLNPAGLRVYRNARMAQFVFHQMSEEVEGYRGVYQGRETV